MQSSATASDQPGKIRNPNKIVKTLNKIEKSRNKIDDVQNKVKYAAFFFVTPLALVDTQLPTWGNTAYDQVTEEETVVAFVYKMDKPGLQAGELRVEIRQGNALWVIGQGDETIKVKLQKNRKMKLSKATASVSTEGVLTVVIPKRHGPRKWYQYQDLVINKFKLVHVRISWPKQRVARQCPNS